MTIASSTRKAGPFTGDDASTTFAFGFKVFSASDLYVVKALTATGAETVLTLTTDYTVSLNADQNNSPGGTVTLTSVLASGYTLTLTSSVGYLQPTDLTNQGGFYPQVITTALDRLTILAQQLKERLDRAVVVPITSTLGDAALPAPVPNNVIGWNSSANGFQNYPPVDNTLLSVALAAPGGAGLIGIQQSGTGAVATDVQTKLREFVSVKDFGAVGDGSDATAAFNLAAATGSHVVVPKGTYLISSATSSALWIVESGAVITGLTDLNDSQLPTASINNTSRLAGRVVRYQNTTNGAGILVGDPDPWMEQYIRPSSLSRSEFSAISPYGQIAITGASKTSDNPTSVGTDMACIGGNFYALNDRQQGVGEILTAYAVYAEARRRPNGGAAYGMEIDIANQDAAVPCTPDSPLSYAEYNGGLIINSGAGLPSGDLYSASFGVLFGNNGDNFLRGIVFNDGSVDSSTLEAVSMPLAYKFAWYESGASVSHLDHREHQRKINTDTASIGIEDNNIRARASYADSASLDAIYKSTSYGWLSGSAYQGAFTRVTQRSAFFASNARFSFDIDAKNSNGTSAQVSLNGTADNTFSPGNSDNVLKLGGPSFRWATVYAGTGAINTSDEREKQDIEELSAAELRVAQALKSLIRKFRFKDAVSEKGDDARIHFGVIAQDVVAAFITEGLDPMKYGMICFDEWEEQPETLDDNGSVISSYRAAGSRYGIRYEELISFVIAAL